MTGGAGFIGSHLVEYLINQGRDVYILDDCSTGKLSFLKTVKSYPNFHFIEGSVLDRNLLKKVMKECIAVFHLAAILGVKNTVEDPLKVIQENIDGTRNVLEAANMHNTKVIFASTSEIYGKNDQLPFSEESNRVLGPTTKKRWCYATAKALSEHMCLAYGEKGLPITIVRYFNVYGPRASNTLYGGVVPKFITAAIRNQPIMVHGTGEQTRCFTYIDDAIKGTVLCLDNQYDNEVFNIGIEQQISINLLSEKVKQLSSSSSPVIHIPYESVYGEGYEDSPVRVPDLTKSYTLLKYNPMVTIDEGLKKTIAWYQRNVH